MRFNFKNLTAVGTILAAASYADAAGFANKTTSGLMTGQAYAGTASSVGDLSTMWNNPASMTHFDKHEVAGSVNIIMPSSKFRRGNLTNATGGNGGNGGKTAFVPALYGMWNVAHNVKAGIAITTPFGLVTQYNRDWVGRYHTVKSQLQTININPNFAYKINEFASIGFGISFQHADVELTKMLTPGQQGGLQAAFGFTAAAVDVLAKQTGKDWGAGFNLGLLFEPMKGTRAGLSYRSQVKHGLNGKLKLGATGGTKKVTADLTTPDSVDLSVSHDINDQWTVNGSAVFTRWNLFNNLTVKGTTVGNTIANISSERQGWKNSWFFALGVAWKAMKDLTVQLGAAYDQTPTKDLYRNPRVPDNNRTWVSTGLHYHINDAFKAGLTYTHIFIKDSKIDQQVLLPNGAVLPNSRIQGKFKGSVNIVGLQLNYKF